MTGNLYFPADEQGKWYATPDFSHLSAAELWQLLEKPDEHETKQALMALRANLDLQSDHYGLPRIEQLDLPTSKQAVKDYRSISYRKIKGCRVYGYPGSGLQDSNFAQHHIISGAKGETVFAKLLTWDNLLSRCISFWSVANIDDNGLPHASGADIDCMLLFGDCLFIIDVKNYRSGVAYANLIPDKAMVAYSPVEKVLVRSPYVHSANMALAQAHLQRYLRASGSNLKVKAYVVLVPGPKGQGDVPGDVRWPGGIPAMNYTRFLEMMNERVLANPGMLIENPPRTAEEAYFASLVKSINTGRILTLDQEVAPADFPVATYDQQLAAKTSTSTKQKTYQQYSHAQDATSVAAAQPDGPVYEAVQEQDVRPETVMPPTTAPEMHPAPAQPQLAAGVSDQDLDVFCFPARRVGQGWDNSLHSTTIDLQTAGSLLIVAPGQYDQEAAAKTLVARLIKQGDSEVHVVDWLDHPLEQIELFVSAYASREAGIDAALDLVETYATRQRGQTMRLRKQNLSGFWEREDHGGLHPQVLVVAGFEHFCDLASYTDEHEKQTAFNILRLLRQLAAEKADNGCLLILLAHSSELELDQQILQAVKSRWQALWNSGRRKVQLEQTTPKQEYWLLNNCKLPQQLE